MRNIQFRTVILLGLLTAILLFMGNLIGGKSGLALAFVIGGYIGSRLSLDVFSESVIKKIFGMIMLVVAFKLIFIDK